MVDAETREVARLQHDVRTAKARILGFEASLEAIGQDVALAAYRRKLYDRVRKERESVEELQTLIPEAAAKLEAIEESIRLYPKDGEEAELRDGSQMARVRDFLRQTQEPQTLEQIIRGIGAENDDKKRNSLRGSLSAYARDGRVFTKERDPDTFGLIEFQRPENPQPHQP